MPELPEVETIRRQLDPQLRDAVVVDAWAFPSAKFHDAPLAVGSRLDGVRRRGKYLLIDLAPTREGDPARELVVHLGMTGRLSVDAVTPVWPRRLDDQPDDDGPDDGRPQGTPAHLRAWWRLDDGRLLWFDDVRRFGRIAVVDRGAHDALPTLAALGPEPFDDAFTAELLRTRVNASRRAVKTQLLSQRVVAGVGNIYADEALWSARVHPAARHLTRAQAAALRDAVEVALAEGIAHGGTTLRNYRDAEGGSGSHQRHLECYGRAGEPCSRCGAELRRIVLDARSTTFCPSCQRR